MTDDHDDQILHGYLIRLSIKIWGISLGLVLGLVLFVATNVLVLKGGENVGSHLGLLSQYLPGYSVTFLGSLVGFVYASVIGWVLGWLIATIYNWAAGGK